MRVGLLLVLVGAWVAETAAQEMWTAETSGTTASLRGVAHGLGQFVAVGSGGIVLVSTDGTVEELTRLMADVGAFPFASASKDAALVVTLPPGNYSLVARGSESGGGVALLEIYEVDE